MIVKFNNKPYLILEEWVPKIDNAYYQRIYVVLGKNKKLDLYIQRDNLTMRMSEYVDPESLRNESGNIFLDTWKRVR